MGWQAAKGPKPYKFVGFGDIHGPKPYEFIRFGDIHGPKPYEFIGFGVPGSLSESHTAFRWVPGGFQVHQEPDDTTKPRPHTDLRPTGRGGQVNVCVLVHKTTRPPSWLHFGWL
jgi:hypothetical protein